MDVTGLHVRVGGVGDWPQFDALLPYRAPGAGAAGDGADGAVNAVGGLGPVHTGVGNRDLVGVGGYAVLGPVFGGAVGDHVHGVGQ